MDVSAAAVMVTRGGEKELSRWFQLLQRRLSGGVAAPREKEAEFRSWNLLTRRQHTHTHARLF